MGLLILGITTPSIISAVSDGRAPRAAIIVLMLGGSLAVYALSQKPGGYTLDEIPEAFIRVIARIF